MRAISPKLNHASGPRAADRISYLPVVLAVALFCFWDENEVDRSSESIRH